MDILRLRSLPFLSRRNFYYEYQHLFFWSALAGLIQGEFGSVVVSKTFHGSPLLISIASATPIAALVTSLFFGLVCVGRRKIRLAMTLAGGAAVLVAIIGFIPVSPSGAIWFIVQLASAQVLLAGVITVRSAIWKSNYPLATRGQTASRLQALRLVIGLLATLSAAALCDHDPRSYRIVFPMAALGAVVSISRLRKIHIRGERRSIKHPGRSQTKGAVFTAPVEPHSVTVLLSPGHIFAQMFGVLREDRRFAKYCIAQLLTGLANLMTIAVVVSVVTRDLAVGGGWDFWISTSLVIGLPVLSMLGSLGRWGRLFDRIGVIRFRVVNLVCWTACLLMGLVAAVVAIKPDFGGIWHLPLAVGLFAVRGILNGLGKGGGALAWNLGHLYFAKQEKAEVYMGIHVSLTGLRGLIAPLAGMWLWETVGWPVWMAAIALALLSLAMYIQMAREEFLIGPPHEAISDKTDKQPVATT